MHVQRAVGPHDEIGPGDFPLNRPLGGQALLDLAGVQPRRQQPFALGGGGTGDTNDFVEGRFGRGFKQQRDDHDRKRAVFPAPGFDLRQPAFADARVEDGFEFFAGDRIGENDSRQSIPVQLAVRTEGVLSEGGLDFRQGGLAGLDEFTRQFVGVHHLDAAGAEEFGGGGFAHANAARQTADIHRLTGGFAPMARARPG